MKFHGVKIPEVDDLLQATLIQPLEDYLENSGKNLRPRLVELGLRLGLKEECEKVVLQTRSKLKIASAAVEAIHSGSLIIDDIQDGSLYRRKAPALHVKLGVPLALNAGNWLYFWALEQLQLLELPPKEAQKLLFRTLELMGRAHFGQALDLGTPVDEIEQARVEEVCFATMELKTGTLFTLAYELGRALSPVAHSADYCALFSRLGVALQALDDVGNFLRPKETRDPKRLEDLKLRRPGWVWLMAAKLPSEDYQQFLKSVKGLPDETLLDQWCDRLGFRDTLTESARSLLRESVRELEKNFRPTHPRALEMIHEITHILEKAYA